MSDTKKKEVSAFPRPQNSCATGMTMRDYFAAKAMQVLMQSATEEDYEDEGIWTGGAKTDAAFHAYAMADSMLKAREQ
jgi:hypothetical protein